MIINFSNLEEALLPQFYGGEKELKARISTDGRLKILHGTLEPGASIGLHTHTTNSEAIYFLEGSGTVIYDGVPEAVSAGLCHYCPKGHSHTLINDSPDRLIFFAVVPEQ